MTHLRFNPGFAEGFSRVLDIFSIFDPYNTSETPEEADSRAMAFDVKAVAADFWIAVEQFEQENAEFIKEKEGEGKTISAASSKNPTAY